MIAKYNGICKKCHYLSEKQISCHYIFTKATKNQMKLNKTADSWEGTQTVARFIKILAVVISRQAVRILFKHCNVPCAGIFYLLYHFFLHL